MTDQEAFNKGMNNLLKRCKNYTGIGSRATPEPVLKMMYALGYIFSANNVNLRSGHADGADQAFESGCDKYNPEMKTIFLPWNNFRRANVDRHVGYILPDTYEKSCEIVSRYHPYWNNLKDSVRLLHTRNVNQVLGENLDTPSDCLICYTDNGEIKGGTATAIKLFQDVNPKGIYFNLGIPEHLEHIKNFIDQYAF